jgi:hypothetical protein
VVPFLLAVSSYLPIFLLMISVLPEHLPICSYCTSSSYAHATIEDESTTGSASVRAIHPVTGALFYFENKLEIHL